MITTKLSKDDIVILSEGKQIKKAILEKFDSLQEFISASKNTISLETLDVYTKSGSIKSNKFKTLLLLLLDREYSDIAVSEYAQLESYIDSIHQNINNYNCPKDLQTLKYLLSLTQKKSLENLTKKVYVLLAEYFSNINDTSQQLESLKIALLLMKDSSDVEAIVKHSCDLLTVYSNTGRIDDAISLISSTHDIIKKSQTISLEIKFRFYLVSANILALRKKFQIAYKLYKESEKVADSDGKLCLVRINIGQLLIDQGDFEKAISILNTCFDELKFQEYNLFIGINNNLAECYKAIGEYNKALSYSNSAIELTNHTKNACLDMVSAVTNFQILFLLGKQDQGLQVINKRILKYKDLLPSDKNMIEAVSLVMTSLQKTKDISLLLQFEDLLVQIINTSRNNEEMKNFFLQKLGEIFMIKKAMPRSVSPLNTDIIDKNIFQKPKTVRTQYK